MRFQLTKEREHTLFIVNLVQQYLSINREDFKVVLRKKCFSLSVYTTPLKMTRVSGGGIVSVGISDAE